MKKKALSWHLMRNNEEKYKVRILERKEAYKKDLESLINSEYSEPRTTYDILRREDEVELFEKRFV